MEVVFRADAAFAKPEIYNLSNLRRRPALPRRIENWSLTNLQQRLVKTGGRLVKTCTLLYWLFPGGGSSVQVPLRYSFAFDRG